MTLSQHTHTLSLSLSLSLIANEEVLAVIQQSTGNHELFQRGNQIVWIADVPGTTVVNTLLNLFVFLLPLRHGESVPVGGEALVLRPEKGN